MEGLAVVANGLAVVSVALQLSETCIKLYIFWESIEDAPHEIAAVKEDLQYLISVFRKIESAETPIGTCIAEGIRHCRIKVADLMSIVQKFDDGLQSVSRRKRLKTAFKAATHSKHLQRFREALNETKATLTLAMVHECVVQSSTYHTSVDISLSRILPTRSLSGTTRQILPSSLVTQPYGKQLCKLPSSLTSQGFGHAFPQVSQDVANNALTTFEHVVPDQTLANFTVQELMLHAISQASVGSFKSTSLEILAQDGYIMDEYGQVRAKTFVYSKGQRYRVNHQASSFRTALGCLRVRTTTISCTNELTGELEKRQTVTSVVFYPTKWLQLMGIRNGFEAIMASTGRSWIYNCRIAVTRAVPENALIFELCMAGETRAVQILLEKGQGSVVDTSPKGWKPLHYAAVAGHTDLCALLIQSGADKSALVYEGPTEAVLSPISLYVAHSANQKAEEKIEMLRLFCDCIDLSDADSDGWLIHHWLKKAYATERKPISQNSITWLLHLTANEEFVQMGSRSVWSGLQHALRSVLNHGRFGNVIERILDLSTEERASTSQRHIDSMGTWLAFRVNGRLLLPMVINAGSFLQMRGFDWIDDDMPHRKFLQALPNIYAAWCHAVLDAVEQVETYMREELQEWFRQQNLTREGFLDKISHSSTVPHSSSHGQAQRRVCTGCRDDYSTLGSGLIEPARIAIAECVMTGHSFDCNCQTADSVVTLDDLPGYSGICYNDDEQDSDMDEGFFDAEPHQFDEISHDTPDAFSDIATMLYRAHGRVWVGNYAIGEQLCASCFLSREQYIGEDGLAAEFPPIPASFEGFRAKW